MNEYFMGVKCTKKQISAVFDDLIAQNPKGLAAEQFLTKGLGPLVDAAIDALLNRPGADRWGFRAEVSKAVNAIYKAHKLPSPPPRPSIDRWLNPDKEKRTTPTIERFLILNLAANSILNR